MSARVFCVMLGLLCHVAPAMATCPSGNLLHSASVYSVAPVLHPERLTDGKAALEGTPWDSTTSALVAGAEPLLFDLLQPTPIRGMLLQGDHRGPYDILASLDGRAWTVLWRTDAASKYGMRTHVTASLSTSARWVRIEPPRPGSAYAISEVALFCEIPATWPSPPSVERGGYDRTLRAQWNGLFLHILEHRLMVAVLGWLVLVAVVGSRQHASTRTLVALSAISAAALAYLLFAAVRDPHRSEGLLMGGTSALTGGFAAALLSLIAHARSRPAGSHLLPRAVPMIAVACGATALSYTFAIGALYDSLSIPGALGILAAALLTAAVLAWIGAPDPGQRAMRAGLLCVTLASVYACVNFGTAGHFNYVAGTRAAIPERNTALPAALVAFHEQYHYYLGAKYHQELAYTLLYRCTAVAEQENGRADVIATTEVRDLVTNELKQGLDLLGAPEDCKSRFTPTRWDEFRSDVDYFRTRISWLANNLLLIDHGYNASPFWTFLSEPIVANTAASDNTLERLAWIDVGLLVAMFSMLWWAFGLPSAALAALLWGTGSIWVYGYMGNMGAFGRMYWLFAAVAGLCLLKRGKPVLGGAALALAVLDRIFPAALFFGPIIGAVVGALRRRVDPRLVRMLVGAASAAMLLGTVSVAATGGLQTVRGFVQNSVKHAATPLTNYVGLKTLFSTTSTTLSYSNTNDVWKPLRRTTFERRHAFYWVAVALLLAFTAWASTKIQEPWKLALAGLLPMFALFDLTNYYYVALLLLVPLAAASLQGLLVLVGASFLGQLVQIHGWEHLNFPAYSVIVLALLLYWVAALAMGRPSGDGIGESWRPGEPVQFTGSAAK